MKVEHQSCCRRLQSTHNQMKCLAERKTSQQDKASYSESQSNVSEWTVRQHIFIFVFFQCLFSHSHEPPDWYFLAFFWYSKLFSVHLALILLFQAALCPQSVQLPPPNDGNQFSQEIRTSMTSRASSSRLIRPI